MDSTRIEIQTEEGFDSGVVGVVHLEVTKHLDSSFDLIFLDGEKVVFGIIQIME
jgi:predicted O-methyltransferase YrrM